MIKNIIPLHETKEHCDICKKQCNENERFPYLVTSNCCNMQLVICKACMDIALNEQNILPEEF